MGEIVGVGLISHVPTIMMPEALRLELNEGKEISFIPGFHRLRDDRITPLGADTIVIVDSHWFTTVEHVVTAQDRRAGVFTSGELPRGMAQIPYDWPGDAELGLAIAEAGTELGTPTHASVDDHLPLFYATLNLVHYLRTGERIVSVSVAQTGEDDDFLTMGQAIANAVAGLDRRVIILASGGMSHRFWRLKEIPQHEASDPRHIISAAARDADLERIRWMEEGDHARIVDTMGAYHRHLPEAGFGHYLMMLGAVGGSSCTARGEMFSDYENATGTGQAHVWFDRPSGGWTVG